MKKVTLIMVFMLLFTISSFATDNNVDFDNKIEIISPTIGINGDVVIVNNLYVSIRINEDIQSLIKLVRTEDFVIDLKVLEKVFLNIELTEEERSQVYKANIARNYFSVKKRFSELELKYEEMLKEYNNTDETSEEIKNEHDFNLEILEKEMGSISRQLEYYENAYKELFQTVFLGPEILAYEGILPYYERTISDLEDGKYELIFTDFDGVIMKKIDFKIKSKETVINEIIDYIPSRFIKMLECFE